MMGLETDADSGGGANVSGAEDDCLPPPRNENNGPRSRRGCVGTERAIDVVGNGECTVAELVFVTKVDLHKGP